MDKYELVRDEELISELDNKLDKSDPEYTKVDYDTADLIRKGTGRICHLWLCNIVEYESKVFECDGQSYVNRSIGIEDGRNRTIDYLLYGSEWWRLVGEDPNG